VRKGARGHCLGRLQARTCSHAGILDHCKRALPDCFFILSALCVSMKTLQKPCVDWLASFSSGGHCLLSVLEYRSQPHDGTFGDDGLRECNWIRISPLDAGIQLPENMCVCVCPRIVSFSVARRKPVERDYLSRWRAHLPTYSARNCLKLPTPRSMN
jgi:hypothetical protein